MIIVISDLIITTQVVCITGFGIFQKKNSGFSFGAEASISMSPLSSCLSVSHAVAGWKSATPKSASQTAQMRILFSLRQPIAPFVVLKLNKF